MIREISPEDFIAQEYLETYEQEQNVIYEQLIKIENNLYIAEKIVEFPTELFTFKGDRDFWNLTSVAFFDSTVLAISTVVQSGEFTLRRYKNKIVKDWKRSDINPVIEEDFKQRLHNIKFEKRISTISQQINDVRNHHIAHLDYDTKMNLSVKDDRVHYGISLDDLKSITQTLHEMFNVLGFDKHFGLRLWNYADRPLAKNYYTDIDRLLIYVASRSKFFRKFEQDYDIEAQKQWYEELSPEQKDIVDYWRNRIESF